MSAALSVYRLFMQGLSPLAPTLLKYRANKGKELPGRLNERHARALTPRPSGMLIWMHGASIGESKLLLSLAQALLVHVPDATFLFTSQTVSSAGIVGANLPEGSLHQMAPIDTNAVAARFIKHWQPDLCVFAEGEIWPNLLAAAKMARAPIALINARMTEKSLAGWQRFSRSANSVFNQFDLVLAADERTASGLSQITGRAIACTGNLKTAFATPRLAMETGRQASLFPESSGPVLLGASTHDGEEVLLLDALDKLPENTRLIIAPRHPDRAVTIAQLMATRGLSFVTRSSQAPITASTRVLLADTFGEMNHWYSAADVVYLGGGHRSGIGGHNPLEPLQFGKPVLTGPYTYNFADTYSDLAGVESIKTVETASEIAALTTAPPCVDTAYLSEYFQTAGKALDQTLTGLLALLGRSAK